LGLSPARPSTSRRALAASVAVAISLFGTSIAHAENCGTLGLGTTFNFIGITGSGIAAASVVQSSVTASNIAFLSQSNAFVAAPPNPQPGQDGGGVWVRGVGGNLDLKSTTAVTATGIAPGFNNGAATGSTSCTTQFNETFGGFQVGQDISRLNIGGWNVHVGATAGAIESSGSIVGGIPAGGLPGAPNGTTVQVPSSSSSQSPFIGGYVAATKGGFFVDALVRYNVYDVSLDAPLANLLNQKVDAQGYSVSGSIGYNYQVPNTRWFIEPSAGIIWSRASVGLLNTSSPFQAPPPVTQGFSGSVQINDITDTIGRVGLRVGTTVETTNVIFQPFVAASVWHDFAGNMTANYSSCHACFFFGSPQTFTESVTAALSTTNVGTFGQYSVGVSGQIVNTGWLGFIRVDYRDGSELQSWSGTGGIRYQFSPEVVSAAPIPVKAPRLQPAAPIVWTGLYVGGFGGADVGSAGFYVPGAASTGLHTSGILAGGTLGYNYQLNKVVLGVEGDGAWTNLTGSSACAPLTNGGEPQPPGPGVSPFFQTTCHNDSSWIATIAGRVGYLWSPRTLLFVKGGAAWEQETFSATCNLGALNGTLGPFQKCENAAGVTINQISAHDTRVGGLVGVGFEYAFNNSWSAKGELDWMGFGTKSLTASDGTVFNAPQSIEAVKVGINYHFGPSAVPFAVR
jgi:outer membrane autotransporter protein